MSEKLPPLPRPALTFTKHGTEGVFTAEQVEEIRRQTIEHCAKVCDAESGIDAAMCAQALRRLLETPQ